MDKYHTPVLLTEVLDGLDVRPGKKYIDATLGGGGHGIEIVKRDGILLGIDTDPESIAYAKTRLNGEAGWTVVEGNFRDIERIAKENEFANVDGILFDLGVSSHQIDTGGRGFSYRFLDAPLDLRMNPEIEQTAADIVEKSSEEELYEIFAQFGEEELARPLARTLCRARNIKPIATVGDIVSSVERVVLDKKQRTGVLSRIFQALRIVVNDELGALSEGLKGASALLNKGGRLLVISFHSLEDRKVKLFLQRSGWRILSKKPMVATLEEVRSNPRARSAKLRIAEKL